jgi:hypothetical protein
MTSGLSPFHLDSEFEKSPFYIYRTMEHKPPKLYEEEKGKDTMQNLISIIAFSSKFEDKKPRTLEELFQQNVRYIYMKN